MRTEPAWRTSSHSRGGRCVEAAPGPWAVRVRDTKDHGLGPVLLLDHESWTELCAAAASRTTGAAGEVVIARGTRRTWHSGAVVDTDWHVTDGRHVLHFTDPEWHAFGAGVRDGEFAFAVLAAPGALALPGGSPVS